MSIGIVIQKNGTDGKRTLSDYFFHHFENCFRLCQLTDLDDFLEQMAHGENPGTALAYSGANFGVVNPSFHVLQLRFVENAFPQ